MPDGDYLIFNNDLLLGYKDFMQTTNIQECYREIMKLIRYVRAQLEKEMCGYSFMNRIAENQMDFSYFQLTNQKLKEQGLKIQVIFRHESCLFEVWMSGYNRKIQSDYFEMIGDRTCPYEKCQDPQRNDYIVKIPVNKDIGKENPECIIQEIKKDIHELEQFFAHSGQAQ